MAYNLNMGFANKREASDAMSATITYDSHAFIKRLQSVGFTEEQAEVFAEEQAKLIEQRLATKQDLEELKQVLKRDIEGIKRDIQESEYRLKAELIRWVVGVAAGQGAFILALT